MSAAAAIDPTGVRCHSCADPTQPIAGERRFEAEGDAEFPVCADCLEGIDAYGEP